MPIRSMLRPLLFCAAAACTGGVSPPDAAVLKDFSGRAATDFSSPPDLAPSVPRNFTGVVVSLSATAGIANVTIGYLENPAVTVITNSSGGFHISLPTETEVTLYASARGYAKTVEQPIVVHGFGKINPYYIPLLQQSEFDTIQHAGGGAPSTGVIGIVVSVHAGRTCSVDGTRLATVPPTGKVVYVPALDGGSTWIPDPRQTTVASGPLVNGYVTGAAGTVAIGGMGPDCGLSAFPVLLSGLTVSGEIAVQPGAYHDAQVFLGN